MSVSPGLSTDSNYIDCLDNEDEHIHVNTGNHMINYDPFVSIHFNKC